MAKIDRIKEQIGWLKIIFGLLTAMVVSIIGFIVTSYKVADPFILILSLVLIIFLSLGIVVVNQKAYSKMDELEEY